jgi:hypothetical protein
MPCSYRMAEWNEMGITQRMTSNKILKTVDSLQAMVNIARFAE